MTQHLTLTGDLFATLFARTLYPAGITPYIVGAPGCGKSHAIDVDLPVYLHRHLDLPADQHVHVVTINVGLLSPEDVNGYLVPSKDPETGRPTSLFTESPVAREVRVRAASQPHVPVDQSVGILFLDEIGQAHADTRKTLAPLLNGENRIGTHRNVLPPRWRVIAASNRASDRSGVSGGLAFLTNRVARINWALDHAGFQRFAESTNPATGLPRVHPLVARFVSARPGLIVDAVPSDPEAPFCTFRSITRASDLICAASPDGFTLDLLPGLQTLVAGVIGEAPATELFAFLQVADELPTPREMLADPDGCKCPPGSRLDAQYAASRMALHVARPATLEACARFIQRLRLEFQTGALHDLVTRLTGKDASPEDRAAALQSPTLAKWIADNRALISTTMGAARR